VNPQLKVEIVRNAKAQTYPFIDYFKGFEKVEAVKQIFGEKTEDVLRNLKVEFHSLKRGYMGVSDVNGNLMVSAYYLKTGDIVDIYLDVIHELVHVKQFMEGKELFEGSHTYVERPTEVEAYRHAVDEARKLGLSHKRICAYLRTEWMSDKDFKRLASILNIKCDE
jgi:hypothetical protein